MNGQPVTDATTVNFRALDRVTVTGEVLGMDSAVMTNFNGTLTAVVLDSEKEITTLNNNRTGKTYTYTDYPNTIYRGNTTVSGGRFTLSFIVPADISYSNRNGKMSLYAYDATNNHEANGAFRRYTVGGTATDIERDTVGRRSVRSTSMTVPGATATTRTRHLSSWPASGTRAASTSPAAASATTSC